MAKNITVSLQLDDFDKLRDGLEIAISLLNKIINDEKNISPELLKEIQSFLEVFE